LPSQVLIVDDHPALRFGLRTLLADEPNLAVCGEASTASEAIALVRDLRPDVIIVDISLAGGSGIELIRHVRALDATVRMVVLTMHDEALYAERALQAGASGFVNKGEPNERILETVHAVCAGRVAMGPRTTQRILERLRSGQPPGRSRMAALTNRELDVLRLIGGGRSTRLIADHLSLAFKTVETHKQAIKRKLGLRTASELASFATQWVHGH